MAPVPGRDEACSRSPTAGQTDQGPHLHWEADSRGRGYRQSFQTTPAGEGNTARLPRDYRERVERRELEETNPPPSTSRFGRMRWVSFKPFSEGDLAFLRERVIGSPGRDIRREDCGPPGCSVRGISQARILKWVAISSSTGSSPPWDLTRISCFGWREQLSHQGSPTKMQPLKLLLLFKKRKLRLRLPLQMVQQLSRQFPRAFAPSMENIGSLHTRQILGNSSYHPPAQKLLHQLTKKAITEFLFITK
ncbi:DDB1- and CUL4-associated factor 16 isoform X5 [Ovis aries]|uniref:DDB1- and CUL4-associated factor 16 isoform X5 n=1 Tax=Ovis aries TaxID=9940 RepID=UPI002952637F|nr:DDB1- and CUL4-associated factor 16 isoform X5 [Ovis aries]